MYGRRHSGVDIIIPPSKVCMPTRLTCRLLKKEKIPAPPQLNEEDAFASRFLQLGPVGIEFIGPVLIELPHFASRLNTERELVIMKSDDGKIWNEHKSEVPSESFEKFINETDKDNFSDRKQTAKIYTTTFPKYFVAITRVKQASKQLNKPGGNLHCSTANIEVPNGSVNKDTKITLEECI
ncbi:hypothetical protein HELRODRAFT_182934 [Helobdella robusta]|uniref:ZU5 domain-containing protein n=1 Tax=Helobdella robusta TaxID=6412 RepID=T1FIX8_HELRO|nr:hypothetical protein HELRODRAFT_182934 [Helobdella robusta]ESN90028.1 hypothetical protein HELRODRAFT_182934 [Helobdella robusta]